MRAREMDVSKPVRGSDVTLVVDLLACFIDRWCGVNGQ